MASGAGCKLGVGERKNNSWHSKLLGRWCLWQHRFFSVFYAGVMSSYSCPGKMEHVLMKRFARFQSGTCCGLSSHCPVGPGMVHKGRVTHCLASVSVASLPTKPRSAPAVEPTSNSERIQKPRHLESEHHLARERFLLQALRITRSGCKAEPPRSSSG